MDMRTDVTAVPHAGLRNPNPEKSRTILKAWGSSKGSEAQSASIEATKSERQDDGGPCTSAELNPNLNMLFWQNAESKCRYTGERGFWPAIPDPHFGPFLGS